jgi:hypothetical protein
MGNLKLLSLIIRFLPLKDIINLTLVNQNLYFSLNNKKISLYKFYMKEECYNHFYNNEISETVVNYSNNFFFDLIKKISKQNNSNKKYEIMKLHSYPPKL